MLADAGRREAFSEGGHYYAKPMGDGCIKLGGHNKTGSCGGYAASEQYLCTQKL